MIRSLRFVLIFIESLFFFLMTVPIHQRNGCENIVRNVSLCWTDLAQSIHHGVSRQKHEKTPVPVTWKAYSIQEECEKDKETEELIRSA